MKKFRKIINRFPVTTSFLAGLAILWSVKAIITTPVNAQNLEPSQATKVLSSHNRSREANVMITNRAKTSGGTGLILKSSISESYILTNAHVCGVVEKGGLVTGDAG